MVDIEMTKRNGTLQCYINRVKVELAITFHTENCILDFDLPYKSRIGKEHFCMMTQDA